MTADPRFDAARLLRRLGAVPEPAMRAAVWRQLFDNAPAAQTLEVVDAALADGRARRGDGQVAVLSLMKFMAVEREKAIRVLLPMATVTGHGELLALLADREPARVAHVKELQVSNPDEDRELTLGERRTRARSTDRNVIARLLFDQDPRVITHLLQNPRLREQDVLRIASRRPTGSAVLRVLFQHPRWGTQRPVQAALAQNPYSPLEIGLGLVGLLDPETLRKISRDAGLHEILRGRAKDHLRGGGGGGSA